MRWPRRPQCCGAARQLQHLAQSSGSALERRLAMLLAWQGRATYLRGGLSQPGNGGWPTRRRSTMSARLPEAAPPIPPDWLSTALRRRWTAGSFWALVAALEQPAPLDLRERAEVAAQAGSRRAIKRGINTGPAVARR